VRVSSHPPVAPYVRVSYTALHQCRVKNYPDSTPKDRPVPVGLLFYAQVSQGSARIVHYVHTTLSVPSKSAVGYLVYLFFCETTSKNAIQLLQIQIYAPWSLPLLEYHYSHFVSEPLPILVKETFHTADPVVVYPSTDKPVQLYECGTNRSCSCFLPTEYLSCFIIESLLPVVCGSAFPSVLAFPECESQKVAFGWPYDLRLGRTDFQPKFSLQPVCD